MTITLDTTLGDLVAENPGAAGVLDRLGLDFCCHGDRTLAAACEEAGLDPADVAADLDASPGTAAEADWTTLSASGLADHIVATHHQYLRDELPGLDALAEKVRGVHGERHAELEEVRALVSALVAELPPHLDAEEDEVFPAIAPLEARQAVPATVLQRVADLTAEHDEVGEQLARLREITGGFRAPDDGCGSYRLLYDRLAALEADTHLHVHKENHTLLPAVRRLAGASAGRHAS